MLMYGYANAQCSTQIGNYSTCPAKFLAITSDNCESNPYGGYTTYVISVAVNQPGAYYTASAASARIVSSSSSGTTLTYVIEAPPGTTGLALMVTMGEFAAIRISPGSTLADAGQLFNGRKYRPFEETFRVFITRKVSSF